MIIGIPPWQNDFEKVDNVFTCVSKLIASKERYHGKMVSHVTIT